MSNKKQKWKQVACPKCYALPGKNCFRPGSLSVVCSERRKAADIMLGGMKIVVDSDTRVVDTASIGGSDE